MPQPETELEEFFDLSTDPLSIIGFDGEFKRVNILGSSGTRGRSRSGALCTASDRT